MGKKADAVRAELMARIDTLVADQEVQRRKHLREMVSEREVSDQLRKQSSAGEIERLRAQGEQLYKDWHAAERKAEKALAELATLKADLSEVLDEVEEKSPEPEIEMVSLVPPAPPRRAVLAVAVPGSRSIKTTLGFRRKMSGSM